MPPASSATVGSISPGWARYGEPGIPRVINIILARPLVDDDQKIDVGN